MSKRRIVAIALVLAALPVFVWTGVAHAQRFGTTVGEGETVNSSLYSAGQSIEIRGTINGDVFCAGQNVRINATVNGDIICAAQNIDIRGSVDGNIRIAAQTATIEAQVARSMTAAVQTLSYETDASVGSDTTIIGQRVNLGGFVARDVLIQSEDAILGGQIGRNADVKSQEVAVRANAEIEGNLVYTSEREADIADDAVIGGSVSRETPDRAEQALWGATVGAYLYFMVGSLLFALVVALILPQAVRKAGGIARKSFGKTVLVGVLASFAIPVATFALAVTFVGLPLALLLILLWILLMAASGPVAGYFIGKILFRNMKNTVGVTLIGVLALLLLCFLPFIGWLVALLAYWVGSGAILIALKRHVPKPVYRG